jgi:hypothetical protein
MENIGMATCFRLYLYLIPMAKRGAWHVVTQRRVHWIGELMLSILQRLEDAR